MIGHGRMIMIAAAVEAELACFRKYHSSRQELTVGGKPLAVGYLHGVPTGLLLTGPAAANVVQALTAAIEYERPAMVIQTGCAGAFKPSGLTVGDIALATEEIDVQLGVESASDDDVPDPLPFPLMIKNGKPIRNCYSLDSAMVDSAARTIRSSLSSEGVNIQKGPFVTVSTITATDRTGEMLYRRFRPCMESMEGAVAAYTCLHYDIPFLEIRSASNLVEKRRRDCWDIPGACKMASLAVRAVVKSLS